MTTPDIDAIARERFRVPYLFPYQRLVVHNLLRSYGDEEADGYARQIVILPTGAGKSLCFQLPAAIVPGLTVIVYPLLSLLGDQERRLVEAGFRVAQLRGGQDAETRRAVARAITEGAVDVVISNPETLMTPAVGKMLAGVAVAHFVIDEAHCISEWGDTFRPAYLSLGEIRARLQPRATTAFTATASDHVLDRIRSVVFAEDGAHVIRANPDRPNITYTIDPVLSVAAALRERIAARTVARPAIVFVRRRGDAHRMAAVVAAALRETGCEEPVFAYHAGLDGARKRWVEEAFFAAERGFLVATCAYGMGVDKKNVRTVIHTYVPETIEAFLQESGRGGRDTAPAASLVLVGPHDQGRIAASQGPVHRALALPGCRRGNLLDPLGFGDVGCHGCDDCSGVRAPIPMAAIGRIVAPLTPFGHDERRWRRRMRTDEPSLSLADVETLSEELAAGGWLRARGGLLYPAPRRVRRAGATRPGRLQREARHVKDTHADDRDHDATKEDIDAAVGHRAR